MARKIIDGRKYDTDTATFLAEYDGGDSFSRFHDELYQKRTGEFFLYGHGGPASKYGRKADINSWDGGDGFFPLSFDAARKWAEEYLSSEEYEKIFEIEDDENSDRVTTTFSLSSSSIKRLKMIAAKRDCSPSKVLEDLISSC